MTYISRKTRDKFKSSNKNYSGLSIFPFHFTKYRNQGDTDSIFISIIRLEVLEPVAIILLLRHSQSIPLLKSLLVRNLCDTTHRASPPPPESFSSKFQARCYTASNFDKRRRVGVKRKIMRTLLKTKSRYSGTSMFCNWL